MARESRPNAREALLAMIEDDHHRIERGFDYGASIDPDDDPDQWRHWIQRCCVELESHSCLEEELLYPAARQAIETPGLIAESEVEHDAARELIGWLRQNEDDEDRQVAVFKVLGDYVRHHLQHERERVIPQLRRAELDWDALLHAMLLRREELAAEGQEVGR